MQRPGPLKDLPLERFLPSNPNAIPGSAKPIRTNKRPFSPGGPSLFSPAKRRILTEDGIYSPEQTSKTPLPSLVGSFGSPARFSRVLSGPASPARILDFGMPKSMAGDPQKPSTSNRTTVTIATTPTQASTSSSSSLAPSPELKATSGRVIRASGPSESPLLDRGEYHIDDHCNCTCGSCMTQPSVIPRELPPQSDPTSIHYPGFQVYQDPHLLLWSLEEDDRCQKGGIVDPDTHKENLPPRRRTRKAPVSLAGSNSKLGKDTTAAPMSVSPRTLRPAKDTPRRREITESLSSLSLPSSQTCTPSSRSNKYKKALQQLRDEMDVGEDDYPFND